MTFSEDIADAELREFEHSTGNVVPIAAVETVKPSAAVVDAGSPKPINKLLSKGVSFALKTPFEIAAAKTKEPEWKLTTDQLEGLTELATPVVEKWIEILTAKAGMSDSPEAALALGLVTIVGIKFLQTSKSKLSLKPGSSTESGKTERSEDESLSLEKVEVGKPLSSLVPAPDYRELDSSIP